MSIETPDETVGRVLDDLNQVAVAAEAIFWAMEPGQLPTVAERRVLKIMGIVTRDDIEREIGRCQAVKAHLAAAGTKTEFRAAEKAATDALRALNKRRPELEQQIAALQAELDELTQARKNTEHVFGKMTAARQTLREQVLMPIHIREAIEADRSSAATKYGKRRSKLESELAVIDGLEKLTGAGQWGSLDVQRQRMMHAEAAAPEIISRAVNGRSSIEDSRWEAYVRMRAAKRPAIERELEEVRSLILDESGDCERLRNYYVDRIE